MQVALGRWWLYICTARSAKTKVIATMSAEVPLQNISLANLQRSANNLNWSVARYQEMLCQFSVSLNKTIQRILTAKFDRRPWGTAVWAVWQIGSLDWCDIDLGAIGSEAHGSILGGLYHLPIFIFESVGWSIICHYRWSFLKEVRVLMGKDFNRAALTSCNACKYYIKLKQQCMKSKFLC